MNLIYSRFKDCVTCTSMCSRLHETDLLLEETELSGLGDCLLEVAPCLHNLISGKLLRLSLQSMTRPSHGRRLMVATSDRIRFAHQPQEDY
jgi:hypothetical protein